MSRPAILVAAFSARAIAQSAVRAGYDALAIDFFNDLDMMETATRGATVRGEYPDGFDTAEFLETLDRLRDGLSPIGFAYGAGFEDRPDLVAAVAARLPIIGTDAETLRRIKDPATFADLCAEAGVAHPPIAFEMPSPAEGWLAKHVGGAGGSHVVPAERRAAAGDVYYQRFVAGDRLSVGFLAARGEIRLLGFTRQWTAPSEASPYRYGGACGPLHPPQGLAGRVTEALAEVVALVDTLAGLCSADFIIEPDGTVVLLEINPRPGATVDVFETEDEPLFGLHVAACEGRLPPAYVGPARVRATGLAWADRDQTVAPDFVWPEWTSDRSSPGARFAAGDPFCTVRAEAENEREALALFAKRTALLISTDTPAVITDRSAA